MSKNELITREKILSLPANHAMDVFMNEVIGAWGTTVHPPKFSRDIDALKEQRLYFPQAFQDGFSPLRICQEILIVQLDKVNSENWLNDEMIHLIKNDAWMGLARYMKVWR